MAVATQRKTALIVPMATLVVLVAYRPRMALKRLPLGLVLVAVIVTAAPGALKGVADQLKPSALTGVLSTKDRISDYDAIKPDVVDHLFMGRGYDSFRVVTTTIAIAAAHRAAPRGHLFRTADATQRLPRRPPSPLSIVRTHADSRRRRNSLRR